MSAALRQVNTNIETSTRAGEFVAICKMLAATRGDALAAAEMAEGARCSPNVATVLRAAVGAGTIGDASFAAPIVQYSAAVAAFLGSLRSASAFDAMLPAMKPVPLRSLVPSVTVGAIAYTVGEGAPTPISRLSLVANALDPIKAAAILILSNELARAAGAPAADLFARELRSAIATVTDVAFLAAITTGLTPIAASGTTALAVRVDLAAALSAVSTDAQSALFWVMSPATAKALTVKADSTGEGAFPDMSPSGGKLCNIPALVTDGLAAGTMVLADANAIAANSDTIALDATQEALVQFNTAPDNPSTASTVSQSLWQRNETALRAERWFGAQRLRADGVAVLSGVAY